MKKNAIRLAPSILGGNHANLGESLACIAAAGLQWAHIDIMDGHFVPNLSFGPQTVAALRPHSNLFFDTHLMLDEPHLYIENFIQAGSDLVSIHVEPDYPVADTLARIRKLGSKNGIVFNPDTPVSALLPFLNSVDLVLAMTVQPGFGGQSFRYDVLDKIRELSERRDRASHHYRIEVDGGVDLETARDCIEAGCDTLVTGTAFFRSEDQTRFGSEIEG